jgi:hypothetical protein
MFLSVYLISFILASPRFVHAIGERELESLDHKLLRSNECLWQTGCTENTCEPGTNCHIDYLFPWSQCQENPVEVAGCFATNEGPFGGQRLGCGSDSDCCNPAASCGTDKLCHLRCGLSSSDVANDRPKALTEKASTPYTICLWENGCASDPTNCQFGTYCYQDEFWSQCRENVATPTTQCFPTYNGPFSGNKYGCTRDSECCNPGAVCQDNLCVIPCASSGITIVPSASPSVKVPSASPTALSTTDCPGPFSEDLFPGCEMKMQWLFDNRDMAWFRSKGLDGSRCSAQLYRYWQGTCPAPDRGPTFVPTFMPTAIRGSPTNYPTAWPSSSATPTAKSTESPSGVDETYCLWETG